MSEPAQSLVLDERFNGPPGSGNGGYCCGRFAALVDPLGARVRLMLPPPLGRPLRTMNEASSVQVLDGDNLVAQVWELPLDWGPQPPPPPGLAEARAAGARFERFEDHPYDHCFVCGPARRPGDGLRLFTGPLIPGDRRRVAGLLVLPQDLASGPRVAPELAWAALDCPGAYTFEPEHGYAMLLGELTAALHAPLPLEGPLVVQGWHLSQDGRKHRVGTAIHDRTGNCLAIAQATWIIVPDQRQTAEGQSATVTAAPR